MPEDSKDNKDKFNAIIKKIIEQAMSKGNFPPDGKFSITIAGGRIPIEIRPASDSSERTKGLNEELNSGLMLNNPHTEVHKDGDRILIYANIPGSDMSNTAISVHENSLYITSYTDGVKHFADVKIPEIKKETMKYTTKNGVLEISVEAAH
ncbi:HSP20 family molecular chaperone IbpA [Methanomicrobium sp. W14]|uniref:Hsp20/alpha crystallin family protein n=1 Tax=Methanomicrobium sp. W14 TaxID=2817839 RepID=UPI001AE85F5F|nr:Hsp20/alpha crystallin family protein [Methanomicrobium sp. W14]MBP2132302.1 HSP20 family molecular chaperone IbpA [Methanomicrobium sp. W14]